MPVLPQNSELAEQTLNRMVTLGERLIREYPDEIGFQSDLGASYYLLARWQIETGNRNQSLALREQGFETARRGIALWEQLCADHPNQSDYMENLIESLADLCYWLQIIGPDEEYQQIKQKFSETLDIAIQRFPSKPKTCEVWVRRQLRNYKNIVDQKSYLEDTLEKAIALRQEFPATPRYSILVYRSYLALYKVMLQNDANSQEVSLLRQKIAEEIGKMHSITEQYFRLVEERREYAQSLADIASFAKEGGQRDIAEKAYRSSYELHRNLVEESPQDTRCRIDLVHAARNLAFFENDPQAHCELLREAFQHLVSLHEKQPNDEHYLQYLLRTQIQLASSLLRIGRTQECLELCEKWIALDKQYPNASDHDEGMRNVLAHNTNEIAWRLVTDPKMSAEEWQKAVPLAKRTVELAPHSAAQQNTLGVVEYRVGNLAAAEAAFHKSMEANQGGFAWDWYFMSMIQSHRKENEKARHWFEAACLWNAKYEPRNPELIRFREEAQTLLGIQKPEIPEQVDETMIIETLTAADPNLVPSNLIWNRAESQIRKYEWAAAKQDAIQVAELSPDDEWRQFQVATLLACTGDEPAYREHCRKMLKKQADTRIPEHAERTAKACLLLPTSGEELEAAATLAEKSVNFRPGSLGHSLCALGKRDGRLSTG